MLIAELLGLVGLLEEVPLVLACALVGIGAAAWARPRVSPADQHEFPAVRSSGAMLAVALLSTISVSLDRFRV